MARIWKKPILIKGRCFSFKGTQYTIIEELDSWRESGVWWEGEPALYFTLVKTEPPGLFEIAFTPSKQAILYQSFD